MLQSCPLDPAEAAELPPSAEEMLEVPAARDCPPEPSRVLNGPSLVSRGDEKRLDDLGSWGLEGANSTPPRQPLWGEEMSGISETPSCHRDRRRVSEASPQREEQSRHPGLPLSAEEHRSIHSSTLPSYWGEIQTETVALDTASRPVKPSHWDGGKLGAAAVKSSTPNGEEALGAQQSHRDSERPEDPALLAMFHAVAGSRLAVKSQQKDEPDFTPAEKLAILRDLYLTKPLVFLERFRTVLREEHLPCFRHLSGSYEADFYCAEVRRAGLGKTRHTRVRNKRYAALQQLIRGGEYFSDEQMRCRDPLLYEQYIGQYLSDEELQVLGSCKLEASCPLSGVLLDSYQEQVIQRRLQIQQEQEEACREEEEEEEEEEEDSAGDRAEAAALDPEGEEWVPDVEEKALLREEFTSRMYQSFLDGKDGDFNYSEVDENPDFDNLDIVSRDEEERYFDGEDPEDAEAMDAE